MTEVNLLIHGRSYGVGCDDGQEKRVKELGQYIDKKVREIAGAGGSAATEAHLLMLASLVMADELFETREAIQQIRGQMTTQAREIDNLQAQIEQMAQNTPAAMPTESGTLSPEMEERIAATITGLSTRLETIAKRLQAA